MENLNISDDDFQILSDQIEEDFELVTTLKDKISFITQITTNFQNTQLAVGTTQGYRIYSLPDFKLISQKEGSKNFALKVTFNKLLNSHQTSIKLISLVYESRILGLVASGMNQKFPDDQVIIFDDRENKIIQQIIIYESINRLLVTYNYLIAVCSKKIVIIDLKTYETAKKIVNCSNTSKFFSSTKLKNELFIAFCNSEKQIQITNINRNYSFIMKQINPQEIQSIWLNKNGKKLACVQQNGTSIDIYETQSCNTLASLYRGRTSTKIIFIGFDDSNEEIFLLSERGTIHFYNIGEKQQNFAILPEQLSKIIKGQQLASFFQHKVKFLEKNQFTVSEDEIKKICHNPLLIKFTQNQILAIGDNGEYEIIKYNLLGNKEIVVESETWFDTFLTLRKQCEKITKILTNSIKKNFNPAFKSLK